MTVEKDDVIIDTCQPLVKLESRYSVVEEASVRHHLFGEKIQMIVKKLQEKQ